LKLNDVVADELMGVVWKASEAQDWESALKAVGRVIER
jgi:hypothetical protein